MPKLCNRSEFRWVFFLQGGGRAEACGAPAAGSVLEAVAVYAADCERTVAGRLPTVLVVTSFVLNAAGLVIPWCCHLLQPSLTLVGVSSGEGEVSSELTVAVLGRRSWSCCCTSG